MIRLLLAACGLAFAAHASAQAVPASNYTDMWYLPSESGWGLSFMQHAGTNQALAVWYAYDPREADPAAPGDAKPLWIVMPGGRWTQPNTITGDAYVTNGTPFNQAGGSNAATRVGSFTFTFSSGSTGTFRYDIAAPAGLAPNDPAYGLPALSGTKDITRQTY